MEETLEFYRQLFGSFLAGAVAVVIYIRMDQMIVVFVLLAFVASRFCVKSLVEKTRHKFNASVAEVDRQEEHKMLVVGFACVSNEKSHAERMLQHILDFMEKSTEAELISAEYEVY